MTYLRQGDNSVIIFNEIGFLAGKLVQRNTDSEIKILTGSVQASILGLLALILGFSFSLSMQRYDDRSHALIAEANSIGTAVLRAQLLPTKYQSEVEYLLKEYIELRIKMSEINLTKIAEREKFNKKVNIVQNKLWLLATSAAEENPNPVTSGAFISSLNDLIDKQGRRNAFLNLHVPEVVLLVLFAIFVAASGILGYSSGLSGKRIMIPIVLISFLVSMIVFIIIDLDRPKRGLIQIDQSPLLALQVS